MIKREREISPYRGRKRERERERERERVNEVPNLAKNKDFSLQV